jgi:hypothetical protein
VEGGQGEEWRGILSVCLGRWGAAQAGAADGAVRHCSYITTRIEQRHSVVEIGFAYKETHDFL